MIAPLMKPIQAARVLGVSKPMIDKLCREGKLEYIQINKKERRFTEDQLNAYIISQTVRKPTIDNKPQKRLPCSSKGGEKEKSVGFSRNDLRKEISSLCP
ncbi:MAG: helix-turn-helix domain-containing protein [Desulfomonilaceae bacterium]